MAKILLVDDDGRVHRDLAPRLLGRGHEVLSAFDGTEGLEKVAAEKPDLVITDFVMVAMHGLEMITKLRATGFKGPIIMYVSLLGELERKTVLEEGANEIISKGESPGVLLAAIDRQLATLSVPPITAAPAPAKAAEKFSPPTILLVDDDPGVLVDLQTGLEHRGYKVLLAGGGPQGISLALDDKLESRPDLIITDYVMPLVDGLELVEKVRAAGLTLPIILYCAGISASDRDMVIRTGATEIIDKEASVEDLYAAVARLLKKGD